MWFRSKPAGKYPKYFKYLIIKYKKFYNTTQLITTDTILELHAVTYMSK